MADFAKLRPRKLSWLCRDMWDAEGFEGGIIHGGTGKQLGVQLLGITVILAWVCATIGPTFGLLKYFNMLRLSTELQISVHVRSVSPPAIECIAAGVRARVLCIAVLLTREARPGLLLRLNVTRFLTSQTAKHKFCRAHKFKRLGGL
jgi:hypothetical protein